MARKHISRIYPQRDADLIQIADSLCDTAERDATQLLAYGLLPAHIATIRTAREAFAAYPADIELQGDIIINSQQRDTQKEQLATALRQICMRAQLAYGISSSTYRLFDLGSISTHSSEQLLRASTHIIAIATAQLPQLAAQGLTIDIITHTTTIATALTLTLNQRFSLKLQREAATYRRIELGNELYRHLITISEKGKLCWGNTSEARYNDYLLLSQ